MEVKTYGILCEVSIFDDGTLDTCVSIKNTLTERETVLRYDSEYRSGFDTEADFLSDVFEHYCEQIDYVLTHFSNF